MGGRGLLVGAEHPTIFFLRVLQPRSWCLSPGPPGSAGTRSGLETAGNRGAWDRVGLGREVTQHHVPGSPGSPHPGICSHARTVPARGCPRDKAWSGGGDNMAGQREKEGGEQRDHVMCGRFAHLCAARTLQGEEKSRGPHRGVGGNEIPSDFTSSHSQTDTIFPALPHCSRISK